jgi:hypothetical protein
MKSSIREPANCAASSRTGLTRRQLIARSGALAATLGTALALPLTSSVHAAATLASDRGTDLLGFTNTTSPVGAPQRVPRRYPSGYLHAAFTVDTPEQVTQAAALGITHTICYAGTSWAAADPTTTLGAALQQHGMKTFLNVENPYLSCSGGQGRLDVLGVRALVGRFYTSPLVAGYWTKDDDCGSEAEAVRQLYQEIRSIDADPTHLIMPGYSDAHSVDRNYMHGQGDVLGFYPYPAYSRGPAIELPRMLHIVRARTPHGLHHPPFIGIYQAFGTPPRRPVPSVQNMLWQARTFLDFGAAGLAAWGWEAGGIETHVVSNDSALQRGVGAASRYLAAHMPHQRLSLGG